MSTTFRTLVPRIILIVVMIWMLVDYFIELALINNVAEQLNNWGALLAAFGFGIAYINVGRRNIRDFSRRTEQRWIPSLIGLIVMAITLILGLVFGLNSSLYESFYNLTFGPLNVAMTGLFIFYVTSASYRVFRIRNLEILVLFLATSFVMLQNAPIGEAIWGGFPILGNWIMSVPNTAGQRALLITASMGAAVFGLRVILGYEIVQREEK
jgi:hypothetical protein